MLKILGISHYFFNVLFNTKIFSCNHSDIVRFSDTEILYFLSLKREKSVTVFLRKCL